MPTRPTPSAHTLLRLMWLASPALPVGGFSYSEGLEAAVEAALVSDEPKRATLAARPARSSAWRAPTCRSWRRRSAPGARRRSAHRAPRTPGSRRRARRAELRLQAEQMGRSLAEWLRQQDDGRCAHRARCARCSRRRPGRSPSRSPPGAPARRRAKRCSPSASAGPRTWCRRRSRRVPLGQSAGQRVLGRAGRRAARRGRRRAGSWPTTTRQAFTPGSRSCRPQHETQYSRLFRS